MSDSTKPRIHMGCGEPLRSRALVTRPLRRQREAAAGPAPRAAVAPRGVKCKP